MPLLGFSNQISQLQLTFVPLCRAYYRVCRFFYVVLQLIDRFPYLVEYYIIEIQPNIPNSTIRDEEQDLGLH